MDGPDFESYEVPTKGWDAMAALQKGENELFFPFAGADDERTYCADGTTVKHESENDAESGEDEDNFFLGMTDAGGFIVQIQDNHIIINSAVHFSGMCPGPMPSVDLHPDCGFLDEPMTRFIEGFIRRADH